MKRIAIADLKAGTVSDRPHYHGSGKLLLPQGQIVEEQHLHALHSLGVQELFQPEPGPETAAFLFECRHRKVDLESLRPAHVLPCDLYDSAEALVASKGQQVDRETLKLLEKTAQGGLFRKADRKDMDLGTAETYLMEFPAAAPEPESDTKVMGREAAPPRDSKDPPRPPKARVLVAEDSFNLRKILTRFLREAGYEVHEAADGREALRLAAAQRFDAALLDVMMPVVDGLEVCQELKARGEEAPAVIMCTVKNAQPDILTAVRAGADDYLVKPFTREAVLAKVARQIQARRAASEEKQGR